MIMSNVIKERQFANQCQYLLMKTSQLYLDTDHYASYRCCSMLAVHVSALIYS